MQNVEAVNGKGEIAVQHTALQAHIPHHIIAIEAWVVVATAAEYGEVCAQTYTAQYGYAGCNAIVVIPRIDGVEVGTVAC